MKAWRIKNPNYFKSDTPHDKQESKAWRINNAEYIKKYRAAHRKEHREYMRKYMTERRSRLSIKKVLTLSPQVM